MAVLMLLLLLLLLHYARLLDKINKMLNGAVSTADIYSITCDAARDRRDVMPTVSPRRIDSTTRVEHTKKMS